MKRHARELGRTFAYAARTLRWAFDHVLRQLYRDIAHGIDVIIHG